jgi:hypothetical protein
MQYKIWRSYAPHSREDRPAEMAGFVLQAAVVFIAVLLAALLLSAIELRFGVSPPLDWIGM